MFSSQLFFFHANHLTHNSVQNNLEPIAGFPKMINCRQCCCCRCCCCRCCCCRCWCCRCCCCCCRCCCCCSSLSITGKHKKIRVKVSFELALPLYNRIWIDIKVFELTCLRAPLWLIQVKSRQSSQKQTWYNFFSFTDVFGFGSELCFDRKSLRISIPANGASSPVRTLNRALNWFCRNKNSKKTKLSSVLISESLTGKWF